MEETYEQYQKSEIDQRATNKASESVAEKGRPKPENQGQEKDQVSELIQLDLFNANPKTEKQLDLFPASFGYPTKPKAGGNKKTVKTDQKREGEASTGGIQLEQTQRTGVETTGYIQHRGLVVESDADVETFI